jgi:hypothetical protein
MITQGLGAFPLGRTSNFEGIGVGAWG